MDDKHYHYDYPLCSEKAIRERCPAFRMEWTVSLEKECMITKDVRVWFIDETYTDTKQCELEYYESDPQFSHVEYIDKCLKDKYEYDINS